MIPVYDFISFNVKSFVFHRDNNGSPESFSVKISNHDFDPIKQTYTLNIDFDISFAKNPTSKLNIIAYFKINDLDWMSSIHENQLDSTLFASVFPFIRNYVIQLTNDSRGVITIPIIDLRFSDLNKGITFNSTRH
ncbi:MAG: hypothetical protein Q7I99_09860 [Acholeplasmataceae bacterium]|nr:hypothetical protein [Acholeplasmataceae bacterium]